MDLVLVGIEDVDTAEDVHWLSNKIVNLRIFPDATGVMNLSVKEAGGNILIVSQFTLHASTKKGTGPVTSVPAGLKLPFRYTSN
jgi:D-tyrosyl-tRNA(Tyr) deacylase